MGVRSWLQLAVYAAALIAVLVAGLSAARLSVLRDGDLAYAAIAADPDAEQGVLPFRVDVPSPGRYRLFLDFTAGGAAHNAAFTMTMKASDHR